MARLQEAQVSGPAAAHFPGEYGAAIVLDLVDDIPPGRIPATDAGHRRRLAVRAGRNDRPSPYPARMCWRNSWASYPLSASTRAGRPSPTGWRAPRARQHNRRLTSSSAWVMSRRCPSSGQDESQRVAQGVHAHVKLGAEPAAAPAQGLGRLATLLRGSSEPRKGAPGPPCCR